MSTKRGKGQDPLKDLRRTVARQQGISSAAKVSNQGLVEYLIGNVDWRKLLPLVIPLILQILRSKQTSQQQAAPPQAPSYPGPGMASGTGAPALDIGGMLGALLGTSQQAPPQTDVLGGLLQTLGGQQTAQQAPPQTDLLGGLLQMLAGGQGAQAGNLLGLLGAHPKAERSSSVNYLFDSMASNVDLDQDGIPDALERMLDGDVHDDNQRNGVATLLEQVLQDASPEDLSSFSRAIQPLLAASRQA